MKIKTDVFGAKRDVIVSDRACPKRKCFKPHDCPVQGARGVRESASRWMCLTNVLHGCPENAEENK